MSFRLLFPICKLVLISDYSRRYFIDQATLDYHFKTKGHKKKIKDLQTEPFTIEDSERAAGLGSLKPPSKKPVPFLPGSSQMEFDD